MSALTRSAAASPYQGTIADYWNREKNAVNHELGAVDGLFHHHYGIGEVDTDAVADGTEEAITRELHRLETAQAHLLVSHLGDLTPQDRVLDSGCGRGATGVLAHQRYGCFVDGITLSTRQADDARDGTRRRGVDDKVRFHVANMLDTGFEDGRFQAVWNNESTMYVGLDLLFAEYRRIIRPGGRYVTITGCINDTYGRASRAVSLINAEYECDVHRRSEYFTQLANHRFVPVHVTDLTDATLPYWRLRAQSHLTTGVEEHFLNAYTSGAFQYLMITADRV